jgi:hypothetical protein
MIQVNKEYQQRVPTKAKDPLLTSKLDKVLEREYIQKGYVEGFIDYCDAPKFPEDIRVVYHCTKSGLNAQLWDPWFHMPTAPHF